MNKYFVITFRAKQDAILMKDCFCKMGVPCSIINAIECVDSICSYVLKVENVSIDDINILLKTCNKARMNVYIVNEYLNKTICIKLF